jgi:hypothetical protein
MLTFYHDDKKSAEVELSYLYMYIMKDNCIRKWFLGYRNHCVGLDREKTHSYVVYRKDKSLGDPV